MNQRTTCVVTLFNGGTRVNALPASAKANVNCRMLPDETAEGVRKQLIAWMEDPGLEVKAAGIVGFARASLRHGQSTRVIFRSNCRSAGGWNISRPRPSGGEQPHVAATFLARLARSPASFLRLAVDRRSRVCYSRG
jgi:acetylornithine deacetylase/succinyl-diaminopimelate desuccinylase-like protein